MAPRKDRARKDARRSVRGKFLEFLEAHTIEVNIFRNYTSKHWTCVLLSIAGEKKGRRLNSEREQHYVLITN